MCPLLCPLIKFKLHSDFDSEKSPDVHSWQLADSLPLPHLVVVVLTVEERLLPENHTGQHAAQTPHVQTVVIHLHKRLQNK